MKYPRSIRVSHRHLLWAGLLVVPTLLGAKCGGSDDDDDDTERAGLRVQCGGPGGTECAAGMFCDFALDAACGTADQTGTCKAIRAACTQDFTPVCGCDGMTYANACAANAASVSVASPGECPGVGDACTALGPSCGVGQFCNFPIAAGCGNDPGVCEPIPEACTREFVPVCGCDRNTYDNECSAHSAGVSVAGPGPCP